MDLITRLENEPIFFSQMIKGKKRIEKLNKKGVFTIEDFINCDVEQLTSTDYLIKQYRAFQHILRYKYLNMPLVLDIILDKEYNEIKFFSQFSRDLVKLGFGEVIFSNLAERLRKEDPSKPIKMIDLLKTISIYVKNYQYQSLAQFYVDYYDQEILKQPNHNISTHSIEELKNQLTVLLIQRNELDSKISAIEQQISTLEGGTVTNGRN